MLRLIVNKEHSPRSSIGGFTLIEVLAAVLLMGIMAAIAAPGMIGFLARSKISSAQSNVQGLLQEAQNAASRTSRTCSITLPAPESKASDAPNDELLVSSSCITTEPRSLKEVAIRHNLADVHGVYDGATVLEAELFDFRGTTQSFISDHIIIILSAEDNNVFQKCIVVSQGLGLIRIGNYPSNDDTIEVNKCLPNRS